MPTALYFPLVFISDLHLNRLRSAKNNQFLQVAQWLSHRAGAVYILGDLWDAWLGDDSLQVSEWQGYQDCSQALRTLAASVPLFYMVGNRDFLASKVFEAHCALNNINDPHTIRLPNNKKVLLSHGDFGCLDDVDHIATIAKVRHPDFVTAFLQKPICARLSALRNYQRTQEKTVDISPSWIKSQLEQHHADMLIHGHTHRPAYHKATTALPYTRWVLHNWDEQPGMLAWHDTSLKLYDFLPANNKNKQGSSIILRERL